MGISQVTDADMTAEDLAESMAINDDLRGRYGRFRISTCLIDEIPAEVSKAMSGFLIVRCEHNYAVRAFDYVALHPLFDKVALGVECPEYEVTCDKDGLVSVSKVAHGSFMSGHFFSEWPRA